MKGSKLGGTKPGLGSRKGIAGSPMKGGKGKMHAGKAYGGKKMSSR